MSEKHFSDRTSKSWFDIGLKKFRVEFQGINKSVEKVNTKFFVEYYLHDYKENWIGNQRCVHSPHDTKVFDHNVVQSKVEDGKKHVYYKVDFGFPDWIQNGSE